MITNRSQDCVGSLHGPGRVNSAGRPSQSGRPPLWSKSETYRIQQCRRRIEPSIHNQRKQSARSVGESRAGEDRSINPGGNIVQPQSGAPQIIRCTAPTPPDPQTDQKMLRDNTVEDWERSSWSSGEAACKEVVLKWTDSFQSVF